MSRQDPEFEPIDVNRLIGGVRDHQYDPLLKSPNTQVILGTLAPGHTSSRQPAVHWDSDRIVYLIDGEATAKIDSVDRPMQAGSLVLIPAGKPHQVMNTGSRRLVYLDFITPPAY
jgi:mannose-6-phosphate isomerase-like protein (cupin superfamily)